MNEQWIYTKCKKGLRSLTSKRTGNIYRWCEVCDDNPVDKIFHLQEELRLSRRGPGGRGKFE